MKDASGAAGEGGSAGKRQDGSFGGGREDASMGGERGDASVSDARVSDARAVDARLNLDGVAPPAMLTATVVNRRESLFELVWTAPSDNGARVAGYQIRYAKVPITTTNFDDTTVTKAATYTGTTPANPGATDGMTLKLYIATGYYFAVTGTDSAGAHVGTFMTTATAVQASFNVALIASPSGTNQNFGSSLDGSGDVNGDGKSDLLVGTFGDNHAYLFFGGTNFAPPAPSVTFTGTNIGFGAVVSQIGDIDHDGMQDIAIADFPTGQQIFIYKGRLSWPLTLTDTQADYVITTDPSYAASNFGNTIAALGDFDGDGVDDFAIGAPLFNTRVGKVVVVYGKAGFTSVQLPDTTLTRALEINGDPALTKSQLGIAATGLGHFYSPTAGTTLIASAPGLGTATNTSSNEGRVYAFHGRGPGAEIDASMADNVKVGPAKGAELGEILSNLGPVFGGLPVVGAGNSVDTFSVTGSSGTAYVMSGAMPSGGPLANLLVLYQSSGVATVGQIIFGGGFSGRDTGVSLIGGDSRPDVVLGTSKNSTTIDIFDGTKLSSSGMADSTMAADVHLTLPSGWLGTATGPHNLIQDIDGDGYPDFALADAFGTVPGRVAVFW